MTTPLTPAPRPAGAPGTSRQDDQTQLEALLEEYGQFLRSVVARLCPRHLGLQISEIEQEARIRLWQALKREREIVQPTSYLYRIVATATIDAIRQVKARREDSIDTPGPPAAAVASFTRPSASPERLAIQGELAARVNAAIATLPDNRRRAVGLHLQGFTTQEIADLLGWTEPKARNLIHRGLKTLREQLSREGIDCEIE